MDSWKDFIKRYIDLKFVKGNIMDKVILNVSVPGISKNYDIEISADINVKKAAEQIFKTISEYEELNAEDGSELILI